MSHLLTVLVALPLLSALLVATSPQGRARLFAGVGAGLTLLVALWAYVGLWQPERAELRQAYGGEGGMVEAALDREGVADPLHRAALGDLLRGPSRSFDAVTSELHRLAGLDLAVATLNDILRLSPHDDDGIGRNQAEAEGAEARARRLISAYTALQSDLDGPRRAAASPLGTQLAHVVRVPWVPELGISWYLGVDGLAALLALFTALLGFVAVAAAGGDAARPAVLAAVLACESGLLLLYAALDLVLFYGAWVLVLLPAWVLLAAGGSERRSGVALQAVLPAFVGSLALLLTLGGLAHLGGGDRPSFDLPALYLVAGELSFMAQALVFAGVFVASAVRLPLFPLHAWLAPVHEELPGPAAVVILGAGLPVGGYALLRLAWPLCPDVVTASGVVTGVAVLGLVGLWFGAAGALGRVSTPRLASSLGVSAAGLVVLGLASLTPEGLAGAALVLVVHGLVAATAALGREAGAQDGAVRPLLGAALLGQAGLPGLAGFPALILVLEGVAQSVLLPTWIAIMTFGALAVQAFAVARWLRFEADESGRGSGRPLALAAMVPLVCLLAAIGVWPRLALDAVGPAVAGLLQVIGG